MAGREAGSHARRFRAAAEGAGIEDAAVKPWSLASIDRILKMLDVMEAPGFVAYRIPPAEYTDEQGNRCLRIPYPEYHPVFQTLWEALYEDDAYLDPYAPLPEDPTQDGVPFSVLGASFEPGYFETATLNQVRRYLILCTRGERFCDGHIAGEWDSGAILAALRTLKVLMSRLPTMP